MLAQLAGVSPQRLAAHRLVVGGRRVEVGVEGHLGVHHDLAPADEVHDQVGTLGAVVEAHLLGEVAAVDQPRELDRAAQVELAPASPDLGLAQGGGQGPGLPGQVGDLLVELPLPGGAVLVEVAHLVAEAVEPLHHLGLVDHAGGVRRPAARPEQAQAAAEDEAEESERECERGQDLHAHEHGPGHRQRDGDAARPEPDRAQSPSMRTHGPRSLLRDTSALAFGSVVSGLLAYVFFALVTRALGPVPAAPVSVLWAWWSFAGAALTFPLQHWITRSVTVHEGERAVRRALGGVVLVVVLVGVVAGFGSWLARDLLFHRPEPRSRSSSWPWRSGRARWESSAGCWPPGAGSRRWARRWWRRTPCVALPRWR